MPTSSFAYFSMEIALEPHIPTYAGGLGILAGDTIRSAVDLEVPLVAVTLLYRHGYLRQNLDLSGWQSEESVVWPIESHLELLDQEVTIELEGQPVRIKAWRYIVKGVTGHEVPVLFLDTDREGNSEYARTISNVLYGGDSHYRLSQEAVLGLGGVYMLRALGYDRITKFHLNEGHAALATVALLEEQQADNKPSEECLEKVRERCVFTTHTPVGAGHDHFPVELVNRVLGPNKQNSLRIFEQGNLLHMTDLAMRGSSYLNGVSMRHGETSRHMFPGRLFHSITNGIHATTWAAPSLQKLFDHYLPDWRCDPMCLRHAISIPLENLADAHRKAKQTLLDFLSQHGHAGFEMNALTIGFARRATPYKRATLIFHDLERLKAIVAENGPLQFIFAGKAHPRDSAGKELIQRIYAVREALKDTVRICYLPNYDMEMAKILCAGVDLWLNTPRPPWEASGTSGMKAALNGVPNLSVLDGWWVEGNVEGVTGWGISEEINPKPEGDEHLDARHAEVLCERLRRQVMPCFYQDSKRYTEMMRNTIALNATYFNTHRMVWEYLYNAYRGPKI